MGHKENKIQLEIFRAANKTRLTRLFRNNIGRAKYGNTYVQYGVCNPGGSDLIGWHTIEITPEMVGDKVAVFVGVETKQLHGKTTKEQKFFLSAVNNAGGIGIKADKLEDVKHLIE